MYLTQNLHSYSCQSGVHDHASTVRVYARWLCEVAGHDLNPQFAIDSDREAAMANLGLEGKWLRYRELVA